MFMNKILGLENLNYCPLCHEKMIIDKDYPGQDGGISFLCSGDHEEHYFYIHFKIDDANKIFKFHYLRIRWGSAFKKFLSARWLSKNLTLNIVHTPYTSATPKSVEIPYFEPDLSSMERLKIKIVSYMVFL